MTSVKAYATSIKAGINKGYSYKKTIIMNVEILQVGHPTLR